MTKTYVIVGAGPVGRHTAEMLRDRGDQVRLVTRSGRRPASTGSTRWPPTRRTPTS